MSTCYRSKRRASDEQLDPLADGLPADGAGFERGAAVDAGGVAALEHQLDVVVDADGAGDALLHLSVTRLQLLQQVVLLRVLRAGAALHLRLVCFQQTETLNSKHNTTQFNTTRADKICFLPSKRDHTKCMLLFI